MCTIYSGCTVTCLKGSDNTPTKLLTLICATEERANQALQNEILLDNRWMKAKGIAHCECNTTLYMC